MGLTLNKTRSTNLEKLSIETHFELGYSQNVIGIYGERVKQFRNLVWKVILRKALACQSPLFSS